MKSKRQRQTFRKTSLFALLSLCWISQAAHASDSVATIPADPHQTAQPQWVSALPSYPLTIFSNAEVDLSSVKQGENGQITVWVRDTYTEVQQPSTDYAFQISETHQLVDCNAGKYTLLASNTRTTNGTLVKSVPMHESVIQNLSDIPPDSMISAASTLACSQAKKTWPNNQNYDIHIKPKKAIAQLTSQEKEKIGQALVQRKALDERNVPLAEPRLISQSGKNICHVMSQPDGTPSPYELCVARGMFSHDVYTVRFAGVPLLRGIDDSTTNGIDGKLWGSPIRLQCAPVNQLAKDVTNERLESAILTNRISSSGFSFEQELSFAIMTNVLEIGRHCTLNNTDGVMAKLDVDFTE